jgi:adenylylsulfate kinase-like enzyme
MEKNEFKGFTVWVMGLPCSAESTLAHKLYQQLIEME